MATEPFLAAVRTTTTTTTQTRNSKDLTHKTRIQQIKRHEKATKTKTKVSLTNVTVRAISVPHCKYSPHTSLQSLQQNSKIKNVNEISANRCLQRRWPTAAVSSCCRCREILQHASKGVSISRFMFLSLLITCFIGDSLQIKNGKCLLE